MTEQDIASIAFVAREHAKVLSDLADTMDRYADLMTSPLHEQPLRGIVEALEQVRAAAQGIGRQFPALLAAQFTQVALQRASQDHRPSTVMADQQAAGGALDASLPPAIRQEGDPWKPS